MELLNSPTSENASTSKVNVKVPKRIIHFSDGTLEEYSDDECDSIPENVKEDEAVDPKTLSWGPWFSHKAWSAGTTTLSAVDYVGESLANFFGITTPKYQYEINEYNRMEAERKKTEDETKGWTAPEKDLPTTDQPSAANV